MKKIQTDYIAELKSGDINNYETLTISVNEEYPDLIRTRFNVDNWRSKENTKKLLQKIIEEIDMVK